MNRRDFVISTLASGAALTAPSESQGQNKAIQPDLAKLAEGKGLKIFGRSLSSIREANRKGIRLSEAPGEGVAYLEGVEFANGRIEIDIRGKDVQEQSFVGVAFHGVDEWSYEAVYFRPFNFRAEDPVRRNHAVQYICSPDHKWQRLREGHPGQYEKSVNPVPDPNGWFRARVAVASPKVSVFVNEATAPSLVVGKLSQRRKGLVGVWVDNSGGDFANLKIVSA
jgi:hypothetical protein